MPSATNSLPTGTLQASATQENSLSIQDAWVRINASVPEKMGEDVYRPDPDALQQLLKTIESRLGVDPPPWWRQVLLDARANRRGNIYPGQPEEPPYGNTRVVPCPVDAVVTVDSDVVRYEAGSNSIRIPGSLLSRADSGALWCRVSCAFTEQHCFVAVHDDVGYPHAVACIDRPSENPVWTSTACGCWHGGATGIHESWVSLVPTDDGRVFVFGAASTGFWIHGFDTSDGSTILEFSSNS